MLVAIIFNIELVVAIFVRCDDVLMLSLELRLLGSSRLFFNIEPMVAFFFVRCDIVSL